MAQTKKRLKTLTIRTRKWIRGRSPTGSVLRDSKTGNMCCLGFLGLACGIPVEELKEESTPECVPKGTWPKGVVRTYEDSDGLDWLCDTQWTQAAVTINDDGNLSEPVRQKLLKQHFKQIGYNVKFVP